jgi:hypothetical protein
MAWNNGYPVTYAQAYQYPGTAQMPMYGQQMAQPGFQQPVPGTQMSQANQPSPVMTPPTIRAEIIQIEDEAAVNRFPVAGGASQMFMTRAEDKIIIKTMGQDGPLPLIVYEKRPPAPPAPKFDPSEYVRRDEVETLVSAALAAQQAARHKLTQEAE